MNKEGGAGKGRVAFRYLRRGLHAGTLNVRVHLLQGGPQLPFGGMTAEENAAIDTENGNGGQVENAKFSSKGRV